MRPNKHFVGPSTWAICKRVNQDQKDPGLQHSDTVILTITTYCIMYTNCSNTREKVKLDRRVASFVRETYCGPDRNCSGNSGQKY